MTKILPATCEAGVVKIGNTIVPNAVILSKGVKSSSGFVVLDGENVPAYIASNATDIADLIGSLVSLITKITTALTALDGTSTSPGSATASIAQVTLANTQLNLTKEQLK